MALHTVLVENMVGLRDNAEMTASAAAAEPSLTKYRPTLQLSDPRLHLQYLSQRSSKSMMFGN